MTSQRDRVEYTDDRSTFGRTSYALANDFIRSLESKSSTQAVLDASPYAAYVKSSTSQIIHSNSLFTEQFAGHVSAVGRDSRSVLDPKLLPVSRCSDELIIAGCLTAEFEHPAISSGGEMVMCRTFKRSMLGIGPPQLALFCVTQIMVTIECEDAQRVLNLSKRWRLFLDLDPRDQMIARLLGRGEKVRAIAAQVDVSEKTIDNRRNAILEHLSLANPHDLIKLMVRLQDNGFCDFGL